MTKSGKKSLDIEKLLQWAYCDELIKRASSSAEGIWDHMEEWAQRGGIDVGHGAAQRYPHFGLPHPDAEKIEIAVGKLQPMIIDWQASAAAVMGDLLALFKARDILLVRPLHTAALVTSNAVQKRRPDWQEERPRPHRVPAERGKPMPKLVGECKGKDRYTTGSYCPLQWDPTAMDVAAVRAAYVCWHHGLTLLAETLELVDYVALPPAAPALPWLDQSEPAMRVWRVGERDRSERPLPLKPERPRAGPRMGRAKPIANEVDA